MELKEGVSPEEFSQLLKEYDKYSSKSTLLWNALKRKLPATDGMDENNAGVVNWMKNTYNNGYERFELIMRCRYYDGMVKEFENKVKSNCLAS